MTAMERRDEAACLDTHPELFPCDIGSSEQARRGGQVGAGCDVTAHGLAWALETGRGYGIWGGLDEEQRRLLRRARRHRPRLRRQTDGGQGEQ